MLSGDSRRTVKLSADRLQARLEDGLDPLYVLSGDEPLLVDECLLSIREAARRAGCEEREAHVAGRGFDWDAFAAGLRNISLFSSRRLVELRLPGGKPGDAGARCFRQLAAEPIADTTCVIVLPSLNRAAWRSKWASALADAAVCVELWPPKRAQLPGWLRARLVLHGLRARPDAMDLLASLVEGNLLAAKQEIDKLVLMAEGAEVTPAMVREAVADGARFDVFQLSDAALAGEAGRAARILDGLRREGEAEALVLWALVRDILTLAAVVSEVDRGASLQQALRDAGVWRNRMDAFAAAARGRCNADVERLLHSAARSDEIIKGVRSGNAWTALHELTMVFCGSGSALAETA